jgi:hypothetical protein
MSEPITPLQAIGIDEPVDDEPVEVAEPTKQSVLDTIKAQRDKIAKAQSLDIEVPGYGGLLALRLGAVSGSEQNRLAEKASKPNASSVIVNTDTLVAAFRNVLVREHTAQEFAVLFDEDNSPIGLDLRLCDALGLPGNVTSAREVMVVLFANANSPAAAIASAAARWIDWARGAGPEVDEDFMGE